MANQKITVDMTFNADAKNVKAELVQVNKQLDALIKKGSQEGFGFAGDIHFKEANKELIQLKASLNAAANDAGKLDLTKFMTSLKTNGRSITDYKNTLVSLGPQGAQAFSQISQAIMNAEVPLRRTGKLVDGLFNNLKKTIGWQISSSAVHKFAGGIRTAYYYAQDLNKSLNNIQIVTNKSTNDMAKFAKQANESAKALNTSTLAYTDASLIFYQQGLNEDAVKERTDTVIKMANVTGEAARDVSSYMTAIWNNFDDGTKSLEYYADGITALGAATAASSEEIAEGLEKFAAISDTVGLSYEYATAALATVVAETRQSADTVGTAYKTMFSRIQDLEVGKTLDDGTSLGKYSLALQSIGVNIKDVNGEVKDMDVILDEMGAKWQTISKDTQIAVAQTVAGSRQYAQMIALMDNWSKVQNNITIASDSSGTLNEQAKTYERSWSAARRRVQAELENLYTKILDDQFFIKLANSIADIVKEIGNLVDAFGGVKGILTTVGAISTKVFQTQIIQSVKNARDTYLGFFGQTEKAAFNFRQQTTQAMIEMFSKKDTKGSVYGALEVTYRNIARIQDEILKNNKIWTKDAKELAGNVLQTQNNLAGELTRTARKQEAVQKSVKDSTRANDKDREVAEKVKANKESQEVVKRAQEREKFTNDSERRKKVRKEKTKEKSEQFDKETEEIVKRREKEMREQNQRKGLTEEQKKRLALTRNRREELKPNMIDVSEEEIDQELFNQFDSKNNTEIIIPRESNEEIEKHKQEYAKKLQQQKNLGNVVGMSVLEDVNVSSLENGVEKSKAYASFYGSKTGDLSDVEAQVKERIGDKGFEVLQEYIKKFQELQKEVQEADEIDDKFWEDIQERAGEIDSELTQEAGVKLQDGEYIATNTGFKNEEEKEELKSHFSQESEEEIDRTTSQRGELEGQGVNQTYAVLQQGKEADEVIQNLTTKFDTVSQNVLTATQAISSFASASQLAVGAFKSFNEGIEEGDWSKVSASIVSSVSAIGMLISGIQSAKVAIVGLGVAVETAEKASVILTALSIVLTAATMAWNAYSSAQEKQRQANLKQIQQRQDILDGLTEENEKIQKLTNSYKELFKQYKDGQLSINGLRQKISDLAKDYGMTDASLKALISTEKELDGLMKDTQVASNNKIIKNSTELMEGYKEVYLSSNYSEEEQENAQKQYEKLLKQRTEAIKSNAILNHYQGENSITSLDDFDSLVEEMFNDEQVREQFKSRNSISNFILDSLGTEDLGLLENGIKHSLVSVFTSSFDGLSKETAKEYISSLSYDIANEFYKNPEILKGIDFSKLTEGSFENTLNLKSEITQVTNLMSAISGLGDEQTRLLALKNTKTKSYLESLGITESDAKTLSEIEQQTYITNSALKGYIDVVNSKEEIEAQNEKNEQERLSTLKEYEEELRTLENNYSDEEKQTDEDTIIKNSLGRFNEDEMNSIINKAKEDYANSNENDPHRDSIITKAQDQLDADDKETAKAIERLIKSGSSVKRMEELRDKIAKINKSYDSMKIELPKLSDEDYKKEIQGISDNFERLNKTIDNLQSSYSTVTDVIKQYNSTGYVTMDQLQAIATMDSEYLTMLEIEDGQLKINTTALQNLTNERVKQIENTIYQEGALKLLALAQEDATIAAEANAIMTKYTGKSYKEAQKAVEDFKGAYDALVVSLGKSTNADKAKAVEEDINKRLFMARNVSSNAGTALGGASKAAKKYFEDAFDRYWEFKKLIEATAHSINKLQEAQEGLFGQELMDNLDKVNQALAQQTANYEALYEAQKVEQGELQNTLKTYGAIFDEAGNLTNYADITTAMFNKYATAENTTVYDEFKKALDRYDSLFYSEMVDSVDNISSVAKQVMENNLKYWDADLQINLDLKNAQRSWNEFKKKLTEDYKAVTKDFGREFEYALANARTYSLDDGTLATDIQRIENINAEIAKIENGQASQFYSSMSAAQTALKEANETLREDTLALGDIITETYDNYIESIDDVADGLDKIKRKYEDLDEELEHNAQIISLLYGDKAFDMLDALYKAQAESSLGQLESLKAAADFWNDEYEKAVVADGENSKSAQRYLELKNQAMKDLRAEEEAYIQIVQNQYTNTIDTIVKKAREATNGGVDTDWARTVADLTKQSTQGNYDDTERMYQLTSLQKKWNDLINDTDVSKQDRLKKIMDGQLKSLQEKTTLTEYDIGLAEKELEIEQARMALEDAQNAKNTMKLTRGTDGNWSYQYVANDEDVADKQQELLDKINDKYEYIKTANQKALDDILSYEEQFWTTYRDIMTNTSLSQDEKEQRTAQLYELYYGEEGILTQAYKQSALTEQDLNNATAEALWEIYSQDVEKYAAMTDAEKMLIDDLKNKQFDTWRELDEVGKIVNEESLKTWGTNAKTMSDFYNADDGESVKDQIKNAMAEGSSAMGDLEDAIDRGCIAAGEDFADVEAAIGDVQIKIQDLEGETDRYVDEASTKLDSFRSVLSSLEDSWEAVRKKVGENITSLQEYVIQAYKATAAANAAAAAARNANEVPTTSGNGNTTETKEDNSKKILRYSGNEDFRDPGNYTIGFVDETGKSLISQDITDTENLQNAIIDMLTTLKAQGYNVANAEAAATKGYFDYDTKGYARDILSAEEVSKGKSKKYYQDYLNQTVWKDYAAYLRHIGVESLDTGGYTGEWNADGRLAVLHQKELVLNQEDTSNILKAVDFVRGIASSIGSSLLSQLANVTNARSNIQAADGTYASSSVDNSRNNNIYINAEITSTNNTDEIKEAILNLPNLASQRLGYNLL